MASAFVTISRRYATVPAFVTISRRHATVQGYPHTFGNTEKLGILNLWL